MTLLINNAEVQQVLTMEMTMAALEEAYTDYANDEAVCRPRIDIRIPTSDPSKFYQYGTMEGGSTRGYFAIRMKSDVIWYDEYGGTRTQEKYALRPGLFCGLVWLFSIETGEPLAIINEGYLQHMRVGADSGIGTKYMARPDAEVLGMIGSGGMARSHIEAFLLARPGLKRVQVFSPTKEHRDAYVREVKETYGIDAVAVDTPEAAHRGADIVAGCTDAVVSVLFGRYLEPGTHVTCVGGRMDDDVYARIDRSLRLGTAPAPLGLDDLALPDELIAYTARPSYFQKSERGGGRSHGVVLEEKSLYLRDLLSGAAPGRTSGDQITYSARGNIQGLQFYAVAGVVYEAIKQRGLGHELPTEWFLQDIRD
jgi:ornithine cyclodeaminase/alanine dehydrogenase-like protein (mu-crystallin family)